jgi:hypothetical protein
MYDIVSGLDSGSNWLTLPVDILELGLPLHLIDLEVWSSCEEQGSFSQRRIVTGTKLDVICSEEVCPWGGGVSTMKAYEGIERTSGPDCGIIDSCPFSQNPLPRSASGWPLLPGVKDFTNIVSQQLLGQPDCRLGSSPCRGNTEQAIRTTGCVQGTWVNVPMVHASSTFSGLWVVSFVLTDSVEAFQPAHKAWRWVQEPSASLARLFCPFSNHLEPPAA